MSARVAPLAGVRERTDAMFAVYPGGGACFRKHIDNTARDGRRLTVLCYLNPGWREEDGGALRVRLPLHAPSGDRGPRGARGMCPRRA